MIVQITNKYQDHIALFEFLREKDIKMFEDLLQPMDEDEDQDDWLEYAERTASCFNGRRVLAKEISV